MTLAAVAANQIQASQVKLLTPEVLASYLLEDTNLQLDKQSIEPLHESRMSINSASGVVELEVLTDISMSNSFCSLTAKRLEEKARKIIGHSPDIIDDILKPIKKWLDDIITDVLKPIKSAVNNVTTYISTKITETLSVINDVGIWVVNGVKATINAGITVVTEAVDFVKGQVTAILDGVCDLANSLFLVLEKIFAALGDVFKGLLTMEPTDIIALQMELSKLAGEAMMKGAKPS